MGLGILLELWLISRLHRSTSLEETETSGGGFSDIASTEQTLLSNCFHLQTLSANLQVSSRLELATLPGNDLGLSKRYPSHMEDVRNSLAIAPSLFQVVTYIAKAPELIG